MGKLARVAFLGPRGTFSEEALLAEPDLATAELVAVANITEAVRSVSVGEADGAFIPIANSIAGPLAEARAALDAAVNLVVEREVAFEIRLCLIGIEGTGLDSIARVVSFPHAGAQCKAFLAAHLPSARVDSATSTAEAVRLVAEEGSSASAAIGSRRAAEIYGLSVLADAIEDRPGDETRFVLVVRMDIDATGASVYSK